MDELEQELATMVGRHGIMKVLTALAHICLTIANPNLAPETRDKGDYFPYHGWRELARKMKRAANHAADLRLN